MRVDVEFAFDLDDVGRDEQERRRAAGCDVVLTEHLARHERHEPADLSPAHLGGDGARDRPGGAFGGDLVDDGRDHAVEGGDVDVDPRAAVDDAHRADVVGRDELCRLRDWIVGAAGGVTQFGDGVARFGGTEARAAAMQFLARRRGETPVDVARFTHAAHATARR